MGLLIPRSDLYLMGYFTIAPFTRLLFQQLFKLSTPIRLAPLGALQSLLISDAGLFEMQIHLFVS